MDTGEQSSFGSEDVADLDTTGGVNMFPIEAEVQASIRRGLEFANWEHEGHQLNEDEAKDQLGSIKAAQEDESADADADEDQATEKGDQAEEGDQAAAEEEVEAETETGEESGGEREQQPVVQVSPIYDDENADVILVSKNGIHFKVFSWILKAYSIEFHRLLALEEGASRDRVQVRESFKPVQFEVHASEDVLTYTLDLMYKSSPLPPKDPFHAAAVLELCSEYNCPFLIERVLYRLEDMATKYPWRVFCIASQHDRVSLARIAIASLWKDDVRRKFTLSTIPARQAVKPSVLYLLGLLEQISEHGSLPDNYYATPGLHHECADHWASIARAFEPRG
ncbi:hypothetical protein IAU59_005437 [Kwoniella sp. CBS 9459]